MLNTEARQIIDYWFNTLDSKQWWVRDNGVDNYIRENFSSFHQQAIQGELSHWREHPQGRLAEIIVIDQFSRNIYRDHAQAYAYDPIALVLAQEAIRQGEDKDLEVTQRSFMYLPFMHSESVIIHQQAVKLFQQPGMEYNLEFELKHKIIIDKFGRYPHRNKYLNRQSTEAEIEFLKQPGSSF